jgi:hypothetical protein
LEKSSGPPLPLIFKWVSPDIGCYLTDMMCVNTVLKAYCDYVRDVIVVKHDLVKCYYFFHIYY